MRWERGQEWRRGEEKEGVRAGEEEGRKEEGRKMEGRGHRRGGKEREGDERKGEERGEANGVEKNDCSFHLSTRLAILRS